jgi:hypothetical protein
MNGLAVKLDVNGIVENAIVVDEYVPDGYQRVSVAIGVGQSLSEVENAAALETAQGNRHAAYTAEADPLFFKWQAGEGTEADWLAKRQEIRDRYPYPAE